ncbi:MAG: metal ABC transporter substrate-binding protein [Actinomycetota bacterium]
MRPGPFLIVAAALLAGGCGGSTSADGAGVQVVTAFYPLTFLVERVGGERTSIVDLTPGGVEPHDLELTAGQVRDLSEAELVVFLGGGFQPAVEDVVSDLDGVPVLDGLEVGGVRPGGADDGVDPHVWLDPVLMTELAEAVAAAVAEVDPEGAGGYERNLATLRDELEALDTDLEEGLSSCERNEIVTSHESFGYLAARYGLEQIGIAGIDPEAEPSPDRLAEVADIARANDVTTIFFEELAPRDVAETLADEVGVETDVLDPLETQPAEGDYFTQMRANLEALRDALGCT